MDKIKKLQVSAIENGSVIDHIPAKSVFNIVKILDLRNDTNPITIGTNLESKKLGLKGIIKISDKFFRPEEINKIALFAPEATLITIKNYIVVEKKTLELPKKINGFVKCINPNCITNHDNVLTKFNVLEGKGVNLKCVYCEKITAEKNISILV